MNTKQTHSFVQEIRSYFIFSRSQRRALNILVLLLAAMLMWRWFANKQAERQETATPFIVVEVMEELQVKQETNESYPAYASPDYNTRQGTNKYPKEPPMRTENLFAFDPNTAGAEELADLGLRASTIRILLNYRSKGGQFRKPEDLGKLYGLKPEEAEALIPWVRIPEIKENQSNPSNPTFASSDRTESPVYRKEPKAVPIIDINRTDPFSLQALPGIGEKRAAAIVNYRQLLGGFISMEQIGEVYAIPDSVYQKIKPYLQFSPGEVTIMSLNTITEEDLKKHPYVGWQKARAIIAYRKQHGNFQSVEELLKIHILKPDWLDRVKPYLGL